MTERLSKHSNEKLDEKALERAGEVERERLVAERERNSEKSHEADVETAKHEALEAIGKTERKEKAKKGRETSPAEKRTNHRANTKAARKANFKREMKQVQSELSSPSRAFSKFIHTAPVEKASEAVGDTVARPNAILAGSFFACLATLSVYLWASYTGYPLSGFETIGAFILGWLVGIIFDFTRIMVTGKR